MSRVNSWRGKVFSHGGALTSDPLICCPVIYQRSTYNGCILGRTAKHIVLLVMVNPERVVCCILAF